MKHDVGFLWVTHIKVQMYFTQVIMIIDYEKKMHILKWDFITKMLLKEKSNIPRSLMEYIWI